MKKLAVLTAVVLLFGVAGFAAAGQEYGGNNNNDHQNQDPAIQANNNDLVGAKGEQAAAANDGSLAVNVDVNKEVNIDKDVDITKIDKSTEVKAEEGGQAANNGSTNVKQEALFIKNELPGSGDTNSTTDSHNSSATTTTTTKNTGNDAIGADSAGAKNYSDNPEAENGSQLLQGGGSQTMNKAEEGGIVATGSNNTFTKNEAEEGGMINTGAGNLNKVTNEGKYAAQNATQNVTETNVAADGFGNIAAYGSVLTQKAEDGGIAAAPGSAVSKIDLQGSVEHNDIRFGGDVTAVTKSGEAKSSASNYGKAESDEAKTGDAFSISKSKSKSGFAAAVSLGGSKSGGGNGAAALGGAFSESEANATGAALPYVDGNVETLSSNRDRHSGQSQDPGGVEATSDESNAFSANGAAAKSGDSSSYTKADADSGSSKSESESEAKSGSAYSTAANFGKAKSGDATSGDATGAATYQVNRFTTGTNNLAFSGSYNGVGTFNANSGVNALNQSPISINAVVGGNVAGK